jgi:hypothetical protein
MRKPMNLLAYLGYFGVGLIEWALALVRTMALVRGKKALVVSIVFTENLVGLLVLSTFIRQNDWSLALAYSAGAALGSIVPYFTGLTAYDK